MRTLAISAALTSLLVAGVAASEIPEFRPGEELRYIAGFDTEARTGLFQEVREDGSVHVLDRREGWTLQELHPLKVQGRPGVLLIWKSFPAQERTSPELWVEGDLPEGFDFLHPLSRVWPRGDDPVVWHDARHELVVRKGVARLRVVRGLAGENTVRPLLRRREVYRLGSEDVSLEKAQSERPENGDQILNLLAARVERLEAADLDEVKALVRAAGREGPLYRDRAIVAMTRAPAGKQGWEASVKVLDTLVMSGSPAAEHAAARLFEMVGREWEVGLR